MKKLELKELGVQEMNTTEMTNVDGGLLGLNLTPLLDAVKQTVNETFAFVGAQLGLIVKALQNL
ncbi:hypothetical protein SNE25_28450 [Mucilaginibacter sabulilitoris]|uniref:Bacteriocin n=1 Tax=Mucilaginibacter sabulilitoris TaxID=1173583 RepID=A0ABZ0TKD0_9SPHI|nr:hypothetical protein [Mucilaginibacter sabulilitoris]WPU93256.1 hypothetical protein SNE25_28450 [Mucilaginibacter sabulilitoris]